MFMEIESFSDQMGLKIRLCPSPYSSQYILQGKYAALFGEFS